ncbi:MAG: hypothetical protein ABSH48_24880 [Verrucomicrobiota bacterium]|jgi:hypothetical protein
MLTFIVHTAVGKTINVYAEKFEVETGLITFYASGKIVAVVATQNVAIVADSNNAKVLD